ncbi:cyclin-dependent kinase 2-associated protein 1-like [Megaptera novaeangliae]
MSHRPNLTAHVPAASLSASGSVHPPSTSMATSSQYRRLLSEYGPPSLGYARGTGKSQVPQSKYAEPLAVIEERGKEVRPPSAGSRSAMESLERGIVHAAGLVREGLAGTERKAGRQLPREPGGSSAFFREEKLRLISPLSRILEIDNI